MSTSTATRSTFNCFGLVIHGYAADEALKRLDEGLRRDGPQMVVTANPEILLYARRHPDYWNMLRQADLRLVDSFGLQIAGWLKGSKPTRIAGVDFAKTLVVEAAARGWKVGLLGGGKEIPGAPDKASWVLRQEFPQLQIYAEEIGVVQTDGEDGADGAEARYRLAHFAPDVLLVAFGHPKQEAWIARHLHDMPSIKIAIGVGGTLDYWSGQKKRAPGWISRLGLEWLYRLIREPRRWRRIFDAVIVFPFYFILDMLSMKRAV